MNFEIGKKGNKIIFTTNNPKFIVFGMFSLNLNDGSVKNFIKRRFVMFYISLNYIGAGKWRQASTWIATISSYGRPIAFTPPATRLKGDCCNSRLTSPMCRDVRLSCLCGQILKLGGKIGIQYPRKGNNSVVLKDKNTKKIHKFHMATTNLNPQL